MSTYEKLKEKYSDAAMLHSIREAISAKPEIFCKKLGISKELYLCLENNEIDASVLPSLIVSRIESLVNVYFTTFRLNRQMAFDMFVSSTGMNKKFFVDKYEITERTLYSYLAGENTNCAKEIDHFLLIS